MLFRSVALLTASTAVSAGKSAVEVPLADVSVTSKFGEKIMSQARRLDNNNQNVDTWVANYSLVFQKCAVSSEYFAFEGQGGNQNRNQGGYFMQGQQKLIHFKLCPTSNCGSCKNGADYAVPMDVYLEMYFKAQMEAQEYNCQVTKENCYCQNYNDDQTCLSQCYAAAGLTCDEGNNNQNNNGQQVYQFNQEQAGRCERLNVDQDSLYYYLQENGGSSYNMYGNQNERGLYVGPQCSSDGKKIHLNVFMDEGCSYEAPKGAFEKFNYGQTLPYTSDSLVQSNCISCKEPQDANEQNNNDQQDADEVLEVCEQLYQQAAKCEENLPSGTTYYANTYGCNLVKSLKAPGKSSSRSSHSSGTASKVFASLFAITTAAFAGIAYYFYQKAERNNVSLVKESVEGGMA